MNKKGKSLSTAHPDLAKEWHPIKNGELKPENFTSGSNKKVWWLCNKVHEWQATIHNRSNGRGCPYCAGKKVLIGYNDLATKNQNLAKEWHPTKNGELRPKEVSSGSHKKVWWQCSEGHEWEATISSRNGKVGCPYCANKKVLSGYNDLATKNPDLAKEWHSTKNEDLKPEDVTLSSGKKVWWLCNKGHEWETTVDSRNSGTGCPYCVNQQVLTGYNDLATTNPDLAKELHPTKNGELKPENVISGSHKKVWWHCSEGHEWEATFYNRKAGSGCPVCKGIKPHKYYMEDLSITHPNLVKEWHPTKNGELIPKDVTAGSNKKVWWLCNKGHEWEATIASRKSGNGCPYCANKKVLVGYNDLATTNPDLSKEWHLAENGNLKPEDVFAGSAEKVWWQCFSGHKWRASLRDRNSGNGCPYCAKERKTSFPEQAINYYLNKIIPTENRIKIFGKEVDNYIELWKIGIEYDGPFHKSDKSKKRDNNKDNHLRKNGIILIRIIESSFNKVDYKKRKIYIEPDRKYGNLKNIALKNLFIMISAIIGEDINLDVDINRDRMKIMEQYIKNKKKKSLAVKKPDVVMEWHPIKNEDLKPENFTSGSHKKVWWRCSEGHEWEATIYSRNGKVGCPYCANKKVLVGYNDLATTNPDLEVEWHPIKNEDLKPENFTSGSDKKVWWQCSEGHEWETRIYHRKKGEACPYCAHKKVLVGYNDLATKNQNLAKEWHPKKNGELKPENVISGSHKKVWWQCSEGHEWEATIANRKSGNGCPICLGRKVLVGYNDLATINPELAKEWHPIKNGDLTPKDVRVHSGKKIWWLCSKNSKHEWEATVDSRSNGCGCPYCAGKSLIKL